MRGCVDHLTASSVHTLCRSTYIVEDAGGTFVDGGAAAVGVCCCHFRPVARDSLYRRRFLPPPSSPCDCVAKNVSHQQLAVLLL